MTKSKEREENPGVKEERVEVTVLVSVGDEETGGERNSPDELFRRLREGQGTVVSSTTYIGLFWCDTSDRGKI